MVTEPSQQLRTWLEQQLKLLPPGSRLPADNQLAAQWCCSARTVRRVMKRFETQKLVERIRGNGTFTFKEKSPSPEQHLHAASHDRIAAHLRDLIGTGLLKRNAVLPQIKQMCLQFKVTAATVSKAYRLLESEGTTSRIGKHWYVNPSDMRINRQGRPCVHFYNIVGSSLGDLVRESELRAPVYRYMERELLECGYRIRYFNGEDLLIHLSNATTDTGTLPEAIVITYVSKADYDNLLRRIRQFAFTNRDTVRALIITGAYQRPPAGIMVMCTGNITTVRARTFALFTQEKGYRSLAFFQRYLDDSMDVFLHNLKIIRELSHYCPCVAVKSHLNFPAQNIDGNAVVDKIINYLGEDYFSGWLGKYEPVSLTSLRKQWQCDTTPDLSFGDYLDCDAWLFQFGADAIAAVAWLAKQGVRVPADKHIICLEDSNELFSAEITHCGYDWRTTGYLIAHALIGDIPIRRTKHGFIPTSATLLQRTSTEGTVVHPPMT
jgi:DNA-binding transcriptional regulator YhcF (GntR family)